MRVTFKQSIKNIIFLTLSNNIRINKRIISLGESNTLTILNLHRVADDDGSGYKPLSPKLFEELVIFLKNNYIITSFRNIEKNDFNLNEASEKPKIILSFDDGYKDFLTTAHPILIKNNIRANQNIIPDCVVNSKPPLNVALQDLIGKSSEDELDQLEIPGFKWNTNLSKKREGLRVSTYIKNKPRKIQLELERYLKNQIGEKLYERATPMMSLKEIKSIFNYYDWGAHSYYHSNMEFESSSFFRADLISCKEWFKSKLNFNPHIYAFPNNSYRKELLNIANTLGFSTLLAVNDEFSNLKARIHSRFNFDAISSIEIPFKATGRNKKIFNNDK